MGWDKFLDHVQFDLGDGNHERFLDLYAIAADKEASMLHIQCAIMEGVHVFGISNYLEN